MNEQFKEIVIHNLIEDFYQTPQLYQHIIKEFVEEELYSKIPLYNNKILNIFDEKINNKQLNYFNCLPEEYIDEFINVYKNILDKWLKEEFKFKIDEILKYILKNNIIYRGMGVNQKSFNDIDKNMLGIHWSVDKNIAKQFLKINNKNGGILIKAKIMNNDDIDLKKTFNSNILNNHEEKEIIVKEINSLKILNIKYFDKNNKQLKLKNEINF